MEYTPSEYEPKNTALPLEYVNALQRASYGAAQAPASVGVTQTDVYALTGCAQSTPTQPLTKAVKFDEGKLRFDLIPPEFVEELARVYTIGAKKYGDNNYLNGGMDWSRVIAALKRHLNSWEKGEIHDPVDKQEHLASVAWCAGALMMYQHHNLGKDDRVSTYLKAKK